MRAENRNLGISIGDVLRCSTSEIDVLAVMNKGLEHAEYILVRLKGRGRLYRIDPKNELQCPGTNPDNTVIICDDVMSTGRTIRKVIARMEKSGYNFEKGEPPHYIAIACSVPWNHIRNVGELKFRYPW